MIVFKNEVSKFVSPELLFLPMISFGYGFVWFYTGKHHKNIDNFDLFTILGF